MYCSERLNLHRNDGRYFQNYEHIVAPGTSDAIGSHPYGKWSQTRFPMIRTLFQIQLRTGFGTFSISCATASSNSSVFFPSSAMPTFGPSRPCACKDHLGQLVRILSNKVRDISPFTIVRTGLSYAEYRGHFLQWHVSCFWPVHKFDHYHEN